MPATLPQPVTAKDWQLGAADAPVTLVGYCDFECGDCRAFYPLLKQILAEQGDRLRYVFRHLPLTDIHPHALQAAKTAEAAGRRGRFWEMHDALFEGEKTLLADAPGAYAERAGLTAEALQQAFDALESYRGVREDVDGYRTLGTGSTPTLFINGARYEGKVTSAALSEALA